MKTYISMWEGKKVCHKRPIALLCPALLPCLAFQDSLVRVWSWCGGGVVGMWCGCGEVIRGPHQQVQWCRHRMGSGVQGVVEMYGVIRNVLTLFLQACPL